MTSPARLTKPPPMRMWRLAIAPDDVRPGDTITYPDALDRTVTATVDRTTRYAAWVTRFGAASAIPWYRVTASAPAPVTDERTP